jgi:phosphohistidine phosphatase
VRTLVLLRHAAAVPASGDAPGADAARPLTGRGREQAAATASWLLAEGLGTPDLALVSSALRAGQTWQVLAAGGVDPGTAREEPALYGASPQELVHLLAGTPDPVRSLLVVGHEPVVSATAVALAGPGSDGAVLASVRAGARTAQAVVLVLDGAWADLAHGSCRLVRLSPAPAS